MLNKKYFLLFCCNTQSMHNVDLSHQYILKPESQVLSLNNQIKTLSVFTNISNDPKIQEQIKFLLKNLLENNILSNTNSIIISSDFSYYKNVAEIQKNIKNSICDFFFQTLPLLLQNVVLTKELSLLLNNENDKITNLAKELTNLIILEYLNNQNIPQGLKEGLKEIFNSKFTQDEYEYLLNISRKINGAEQIKIYQAEQIPELKAKLLQSNEAKEALRTELLKSNEEKEALRTALLESNQVNEKLRTELLKSNEEKEALRTAHQNEIDKLRKELLESNKAKKTYIKLKTELLKLNKEKSEVFDSRIYKKEEKKHPSNDIFSTPLEENKELRTELLESNEAKEALRKELLESNEKQEELRKELLESNEEITALKAALLESNEKLTAANEEIEKLLELNKELRTENEEITALKAALLESNEKLTAANKEKEALKAALLKLKNNNTKVVDSRIYKEKEEHSSSDIFYDCNDNSKIFEEK